MRCSHLESAPFLYYIDTQMLTLTKKTEYALIASCHLANVDDDQPVSAREMAEAYNIRLPLMMNTLKALSQAGILRSQRGVQGGYALIRSPERITLAQLIEAVEGPPKLVRCASKPSQDVVVCELMESCPVRSPLARVHKRFVHFLSGVTLAELADEHRAADAGDTPTTLHLVKAIAQ